MLLIISCWTSSCLKLAAFSKKSVNIIRLLILAHFSSRWHIAILGLPLKQNGFVFIILNKVIKCKTLFYRIMWRIDFYLIQWYFTITFCFLKIKALSSFTFSTMANIKYRMMICFLKHLFLRVFVIYFK